MATGKRFTVVDKAGNTRVVVETAERIPGPGLMGGGPMPMRPVYALEDGTPLEPLMGDKDFFDRRTGAMYTRT